MDRIATKGLFVSYEDKCVIESLNLKIPQKKITVIVGPNGCGKSTALKAIGRILRPKKGIVYLDGKDIQKLSTKEVARRMAILPQSPQAPAGLTVEELVTYGRFPHQKGFGSLTAGDKDTILWALEMTKLQELKDTAVENLSGGQRQRVWIAMAIAQQTELILLDEPTTYLDMAYQLEVLELLYRLNREQDCTIAMVLHDLNLASRFADYMIALRDGRIVCHGEPERVMTREILRETFQIEAEILQDTHTGKPICISYDLIRKI